MWISARKRLAVVKKYWHGFLCLMSLGWVTQSGFESEENALLCGYLQELEVIRLCEWKQLVREINFIELHVLFIFFAQPNGDCYRVPFCFHLVCCGTAPSERACERV